MPQIDRQKLRAFVRKLDEGAIYELLDRAIELLPASKLATLVDGYASPDTLKGDGASKETLLSQVRDFHASALRGDHYDAFAVNSRNYTSKSRGTQRFIADFHRHLDACIAASRKQATRQHAKESFELLFDLLRQIDECRIDIVFFADEAGAWQVNVRWPKVLPAYARCLSAAADPEEFATGIARVMETLSPWERDTTLPLVRKSATKQQNAALQRRLPARRR